MEPFDARSFVQAAISNSGMLSAYVTESIGRLARLTTEQMGLVRSELDKYSPTVASEDGAATVLKRLVDQFVAIGAERKKIGRFVANGFSAEDAGRVRAGQNSAEPRHVRLLNSAMMPCPGTYVYRRISAEEFAERINRAEGEKRLISYVGYQQTADVVQRLAGIKVPLSREQTVLDDGDGILVVKLAYRVKDPATKGQPTDGDFEFGEVAYSAPT